MDLRAEIVRELVLKRRRARVPGVYVVYHRERPGGGALRRSVLAAQERRDVEWRGKLGVELAFRDARRASR